MFSLLLLVVVVNAYTTVSLWQRLELYDYSTQRSLTTAIYAKRVINVGYFRKLLTVAWTYR